MPAPRTLAVIALFSLTGCGHERPQAADPSLCQFAQGPCQVQNITLNMTPANAPSEQPIALSLELPPGTRMLSAFIEGRDMYMGHIPVIFDDGGQAEVIYGSCSSDYMVWRLTVKLENNDGTQVSRQFDWLADNDPL